MPSQLGQRDSIIFELFSFKNIEIPASVPPVPLADKTINVVRFGLFDATVQVLYPSSAISCWPNCQIGYTKIHLDQLLRQRARESVFIEVKGTDGVRMVLPISGHGFNFFNGNTCRHCHDSTIALGSSYHRDADSVLPPVPS